ncbi:HDIG domain-containing protein [Candidatus Microgenomates bacterium]|nr:MAG: HDIG domain-containing protein [Candidatus Microgenomates bacterium]
MNRQEALALLHKHTINVNLRRHCYAVEVVMKALASRLGESEKADIWGIAGLLHDADYESLKDTPEVKTEHTRKTIRWLKELNAQVDIQDAIAAHAWGYVEGAPQPKSKMEWALYTCDELTGLIVAVALVKPDRKLASVGVDSVMKKWKETSFASGVNRGQIEKCKDYLDIPLQEFVRIALNAMQSIAPELGL